MVATTTSYIHIDEARLEHDLPYRFKYLSGFIDFEGEDIYYIHAIAPALLPLFRSIVDNIYVKLFTYDVTKRRFMLRSHGYTGKVVAEMDSLTLDDDQIKFRKAHLGNYLRELVTAKYDDRFVEFLDGVGQIHTMTAGNREIHIPLIQMNAFMGYLAEQVLQAIVSMNLDTQVKFRTICAFNKLFWIQNDLIARRYGHETADEMRA